MSYWILQLVGWACYFYAQASGEVIFASVSWAQASTLWGVVCLASIGLTHSLRLLIRRRGWLSLPPAALLGRVAVAVLLISLIAFGVTVALSERVYGSPVSPLAHAFYQRLSLDGQLRNQFIFMLIVNVAWAALYLTFAMQRHRYRAEIRQAQLGEALRAAELRLLQSQLNPHFLFNALNGLRSLIADEPLRARDAVTQLARMLRYTLASSGDDLVSLERELEMVDDYLSLESLRLAERLSVERDVHPEARTVRVPAMLLQTLVENALKHGIAELKEGGTLNLHAHVVGEELILRVDNPCPPERQKTPAGQGVGLRNATERLRLLFGGRASLRLIFPEPGRAAAEVRLPR
jgi:sensor histidine kinase YesM